MKTKNEGFTMLEVMIALAVMGGVLLTVIYSLNYHLGIAERHESVTIASMLAREKLHDAELSPGDTTGDFEAPYDGYHFKTALIASQFPGFLQLSVTVTKEKESVTLSELIPKGEG